MSSIAAISTELFIPIYRGCPGCSVNFSIHTQTVPVPVASHQASVTTRPEATSVDEGESTPEVYELGALITGRCLRINSLRNRPRRRLPSLVLLTPNDSSARGVDPLPPGVLREDRSANLTRPKLRPAPGFSSDPVNGQRKFRTFSTCQKPRPRPRCRRRSRARPWTPSSVNLSSHESDSECAFDEEVFFAVPEFPLIDTLQWSVALPSLTAFHAAHSKVRRILLHAPPLRLDGAAFHHHRRPRFPIVPAVFVPSVCRSRGVRRKKRRLPLLPGSRVHPDAPRCSQYDAARSLPDLVRDVCRHPSVRLVYNPFRKIRPGPAEQLCRSFQ